MSTGRQSAADNTARPARLIWVDLVKRIAPQARTIGVALREWMWRDDSAGQFEIIGARRNITSIILTQAPTFTPQPTATAQPTVAPRPTATPRPQIVGSTQ